MTSLTSPKNSRYPPPKGEMTTNDDFRALFAALNPAKSMG
jgi:hypothetical protein